MGNMNKAKRAQILEMLDAKSPTKFSMDPNDIVHRDLMLILENFERVFVAFLNQNYRSFTEKDVS